MVEYILDGITVNFPYDAYPCQVKYMEKVIACLNKGWNGVLKSPTGTGKTLCLLCACLAWQQNQKRLQLEAAAAQLGQQFSNLSSSGGPIMLSKNGAPIQTSTNQCITYPKILYTSRTHMQLSQVIRELNKTVYKTVKTCLMGSRDQLCINEEVKNEENSTLKNHMCRAKVKTRTCHFFNGYDALISQNGSKETEMRENGKNASSDSGPATTSALDIEDFISFGKRKKICPFYASRDKPEEADLILLPYNYVVDVKARKANKIDLSNAIVIFDEAHNLEKVCEDSASFTFSTREIAGALREAKEALNAIMLDEEALRREMDETSLAFGAANSDDIPQIKIDVKELADLILLLESLQTEIKKIDVKEQKAGKSSISLPGLTLPGAFLLDLLQSAGIYAMMRDSIYNLIDKVTSYLTEKATNTVWQSRGAALQRFASFLNTVFSSDNEEMDLANEIETYKKHSRHFKVYINPMEEEKPTSLMISNFLKNYPKQQSFQLNYWCFNAGLTMQNLMEKEVHSILVTSGTLSPLSHFQAEMKIPFQLTLQNDHVIKPSQAWFGVVCQGPDGCALDSSYSNRQNEAYILSLGNMLVNVFRLVPEGSLIFFASYAQMSSCIERWQIAGSWERMAKHKALYVEPKSKDEFYRILNEYNSVVKTRPAAFFAVCRGKVSEGIDFADSAARGVVMMGIPFPPMYDPRVVLKKEFLANQQSSQQSCSSQTSTNSNMSIDGETWYRTEAIRSINQSIGRVIRHKDDYGAVILADQRFSSWNRDRFPSWIVPNYHSYPKFGEFSKSLAQFFKDKSPKIEKKSSDVTPNECGFEMTSNVRMRTAEARQTDEMCKKRKYDSSTKPFNSTDYIGAYSCSIPPVKKVTQDFSSMWEELEKCGGFRVDNEFFDYLPPTVKPTMPKVEAPKNRPKIKIKRTIENETGAGQASASNEQPKRQVDPEKKRMVDEFQKLSRERLGQENHNQFMDLINAYRDDKKFEPLLTFFKGLPWVECSVVIKEFSCYVRPQHLSVYASFVEQAEKAQSSASSSEKPRSQLDPEKVRMVAKYRKLWKERLSPENHQQLIDLTKAYHAERIFQPLLTFFKRLPFAENADVVKGFSCFVLSQDRSVYWSFVEEAEKAENGMKRQ